MQPCLVANVAISKVTLFQPNHVTLMTIVSIKTVLLTVPVMMDTLEMVLNVLISMNVSKVVTTVMQTPPVPILLVDGLAHVTPATVVMVLVVLTLMNVLLSHVTLMVPALTMMAHTHVLVTTALTVMVKHALTSMNVFQSMPAMLMPPVQTATVHTAVHVTVVTLVTVMPALTMMNVHWKQITVMLTHHAQTTKVHLPVLVMRDGKDPEMFALTSTSVLPILSHVIHMESVLT